MKVKCILWSFSIGKYFCNPYIKSGNYGMKLLAPSTVTLISVGEAFKNLIAKTADQKLY